MTPTALFKVLCALTAALAVSCTARTDVSGFGARNQDNQDGVGDYDAGGNAEVHPPRLWYPLGASELAPYSTLASWGSNAGGGISNTAGPSAHASLASGPLGAWALWENVAPEALYVTRFSGGTWEHVGFTGAPGPLISADDSFSISGADIAADSRGYPIVVWAQYGGDAGDILGLQFDGSSWIELGPSSASGGGISDSAASSQSPRVAVGTDDLPVVVWSEGDSPAQIYVKRFDGSAWREYGAGSASGTGMSDTSGASVFPDIAAAPDGTVVVAWSDASFGAAHQIYVRKSDGVASWVELAASATDGGVSDTATRSVGPSIAVGASGRIAVAWSEYDSASGDIDVQLRWFDGASWIGLANSHGPGGISQSASGNPATVAVDASDRVTVAWSDYSTGRFNAFARRFDGVAWLSLGPTAVVSDSVDPRSSGTIRTALAIDPDTQQPMLLWEDVSSLELEIYAAIFDGASWSSLGQGTAQGSGISNPSYTAFGSKLRLDSSDNPVVSWVAYGDVGTYEYYLFAKRWTGSAWGNLGTTSDVPPGILGPRTRFWGEASLSIGSDGEPAVCWGQVDDQGTNVVHVRAFSGSRWDEVGSVSATGGGLNTGADAGIGPAMVHGPSGEPIIVWSGERSGAFDIFIKRYTASGWEPWSAGSASEGGLSNTGEDTVGPFIALDSQGRPVIAMSQKGSASQVRNVFVIRWDGTVWAWVGPDPAVEVLGISATSELSIAFGVMVDETDAPVVGWLERSAAGSSQYFAYSMRFDGTSWQEMGADSASNEGMSRPANRVHSAVLVPDQHGAPVIAWEDNSSTNGQIYVKRFDGTQWTEWVPGSASGGGISNSAGASRNPSMQFGKNRVCASWTEAGQFRTDVVVRCSDYDFE